MPLSEHERRLLSHIEKGLSADDPRLDAVLRGVVPRTARPRRAGLAALGLVLGLAGLVGGMQVHPLVSVLGWVVMVLSALSGMGALGHGTDGPRRVSPAHPSRQSELAHRERPRPDVV